MSATRSDSMSLQVNLSGRDISEAYQNVVAGGGIDWALFTYERGGNDLKVQSTGNGGLEELAEEFSDGRYATAPWKIEDHSGLIFYNRIQYAFARVTDPNVKHLKNINTQCCSN